MRLFGTSGIRRIADRELFELAIMVGMAVGKVYKSVAVGRDTRTTGDLMRHAFITGLLASGSQSYDVGMLPTPTLALATRERRAGAMITASHNPPEYNGIKMLNPDGSAFDPAQQAQIEKMIENESLPAAGWSEIKQDVYQNGFIEEHIRHIMGDIPQIENLKVVLDCGCGAASVISPELLKRLGCEVIAINCFPTGFFPREVEPTEENLQTLIRATAESKADLGIAHDGDADRMMAVDDRGRFISGDKLLALFARECEAGTVVTTVDASMTIDELGYNVTRTPVGDTFVSDKLKKSGDFGGEPSGSWVFPKNSLCADGIYAAAKLASIAGKGKLSEMLDQIPQYPILRGGVKGSLKSMPELEKRLMELKPESVDCVDGIKLNFRDGWLLVRPSGTEPKVRVTAEAKTDGKVRELYDKGVSVITKYIERQEI